MNDNTSSNSGEDFPRLRWTENGEILIPMYPAYDADNGEARRETLDRDDTAANLIAATAWVLDGISRMRRRLGPEIPAGTYAAAEELIRIGTAMQDELVMSTMANSGDMARVKGIHRQTAISRRTAIRKTEDTISDTDREWRYRIGYRPRGEDARTWYTDSYYEQNEAAEAAEAAAAEWEHRQQQRREHSHGGSTVVNISTGTTGIQSGGSVNGRNVEQ